MYARAQTWWTILRIALEERLVYRGDFALGTLMRFLPIITQIFLWYAIFDSIGQVEGQEAATIGGFGFREIVAYYLLTMIARAFSSMPGLTTGIAAQVRNGEIKKFLIQPIDMVGCLLIQRVAHKLVYYLMAAVPFALVGRFLFGCRVVFVETITCINQPSLTGRIMYRLAHDFFYQWKSLENYFPRGRFGGPLL